MKVVIQRVSEAQVSIEGALVASIGPGLLILVGIVIEDTQEDVSWLSHKIVNLRIFGDDQGLMNKSLLESQGDLLVVSQFTLHALTKKGHRPSYIKAAKPEVAIPLYEALLKQIAWDLKKEVQAGQFGADMKVTLVNDGPVTIIIDSKLKA